MAVRKEKKSKIQAKEISILRRIEGVRRKDQIINDENFIEAGASRGAGNGEEETVGVKGRLEGMDNERCAKRAFEGVVKGRRPKGRP